jgi:hypothetical protein
MMLNYLSTLTELVNDEKLYQLLMEHTSFDLHERIKISTFIDTYIL